MPSALAACYSYRLGYLQKSRDQSLHEISRFGFGHFVKVLQVNFGEIWTVAQLPEELYWSKDKLDFPGEIRRRLINFEVTLTKFDRFVYRSLSTRVFASHVG